MGGTTAAGKKGGLVGSGARKVGGEKRFFGDMKTTGKPNGPLRSLSKRGKGRKFGGKGGETKKAKGKKAQAVGWMTFQAPTEATIKDFEPQFPFSAKAPVPPMEIGVGLMLGAKDSQIVVSRVLVDSPAAEDGRIKPGDIISEIGESEASLTRVE